MKLTTKLIEIGEKIEINSKSKSNQSKHIQTALHHIIHLAAWQGLQLNGVERRLGLSWMLEDSLFLHSYWPVATSLNWPWLWGSCSIQMKRCVCYRWTSLSIITWQLFFCSHFSSPFWWHNIASHGCEINHFVNETSTQLVATSEFTICQF